MHVFVHLAQNCNECKKPVTRLIITTFSSKAYEKTCIFSRISHICALCYDSICDLVSALFIMQGIVGNVCGLKVEGNARDSIVKKTLVS